MTIKIKTSDEIEKMRKAGRLAAEVLTMITPHVAPGVTTEELNTLCHDYITHEQQAIPAPLNYHGFPKSICTSVNDVICHGIPADRKLKKGDIVNIDVTVIKEGYHGDTSMMFHVGEFSAKERQTPQYRARERLIHITRECLFKGIAEVKPGASLKTIGKTIQTHAEHANYSVVREYCGHGIGAVFHEEPQVVHYDDPQVKDVILQEGMTFTIEPMINMGKSQIKTLNDGWTVKTKDRSLSAQWEHTLLVTAGGVEILTQRDQEQFLYLS
ncbi:Methionine aminopeptidase [Piscirickettsia salmonis]|uniref:Methionine aminopeptidase n=1 Tax=Piscirickettsia salmonis TaxID=1238 RepID=A0A1L6T9Q7_PISSA|nr:type I methionyl aminopeptidase [Piscirickettsia salmonis]AKP73209.2 methionine aminopeptidase [Piscirickettsia salmonis LF-89 = ATCC VR-1361]ALB21896.1 methionine aminopeptidase, type I [Piscirickettsia salmonis]ALY02069.1 methionine aminopeptidase [Piscirickettsia salmonis]AMA41582.1 methionine aminopeptidase [Piscirickettsia salmonis]AOS34065.1 methionine aminopeptidase [Piscirickettsia salmonis]